jgi:magnesium transporter
MKLAALLVPDLRQVLKEDPDQLRELLDEIHPEDLADLVADLDPEEAAELMARMPAASAAPIFERLEEHEQEEIVGHMAPESVAQIASEMEADDRADLFSALSDDVGDKILEKLQRVDPEAAEEVREIERYPETSAAHLMTTRYVSVSPDETVADALLAVRRLAEQDDEPIYNVYAMGKSERLVGFCALRDLIRATPETRLDDILRTNVISVPPEADQEDVARKMAKYDLNAMPVIDEKGVLLGVITIDDVIDVLAQEQTEDVQKIGGIEPLDVPYFQTSFIDFIKKRGVWLVVLFVEEFFTQTALRYYDPVFEAF